MADKFTPQEFRKALEELKETKQMQLEFHAINAEIIRAKYLSLRLNGFTDEQALELCKP